MPRRPQRRRGGALRRLGQGDRQNDRGEEGELSTAGGEEREGEREKERGGRKRIRGSRGGSISRRLDRTQALLRPQPPKKKKKTLQQDKDTALLSSLGGPSGLAARLCTNLDAGPALVPASVATTPSIDARRAAFGANKFKQVASKSFLRLFFESLKDPILVLLMAAALVSTVLGAAIPEEREQAAWSEGIAIWVAVLVVSLVSSGNDYQKDLQFRKLNAQKERVMIKVLRGGVDMLVLNTELVVGDVVRLITGELLWEGRRKKFP